MLFFCLIQATFAEVLSEDLANRLSAGKGEVLELNDKEIRNLVYSNYPDVFILFYHSDLLATQELLRNWKHAAEGLSEMDSVSQLCEIDLMTKPKMFKKFLLDKYPCAVYLRSGYFHNYTGPFDVKSVIDTVTKKTYLDLQTYISPSSLTLYDYFMLIYSQGMPKHMNFLFKFGFFSLVLFILLLAAISVHYRDKPKSD